MKDIQADVRAASSFVEFPSCSRYNRFEGVDSRASGLGSRLPAVTSRVQIMPGVSLGGSNEGRNIRRHLHEYCYSKSLKNKAMKFR